MKIWVSVGLYRGARCGRATRSAGPWRGRSASWRRSPKSSTRPTPNASTATRRSPPCRAKTGPGTNCRKIGLPGKSILGDHFQENQTSRRPFLLLRVSFPRRAIFIQSIPIGNCIEISLPGKLILWDYFQENRTSQRPFLLLRIDFPGRLIYILNNCLQRWIV